MPTSSVTLLPCSPAPLFSSSPLRLCASVVKSHPTIGATPDVLDAEAFDRTVILRNLPQDCQSRADPSPIGVVSGYLDGHEPVRRDSEGARSDGLHIRPRRHPPGHLGDLRMATRNNRSTRRTTKRATTRRTTKRTARRTTARKSARTTARRTARTTARKTARKTNWNKSSFKFSSFKKNAKRTAKRSTAKRSARKSTAKRAFSYKFSTARRSYRRAA